MANHGLGVAYMQLGDPRSATQYLIRTMQLVDMDLAINADEAGQLDAVYDRLLQNIQQADDTTLEALNNRFFNLLTGEDWKQRVELTRHQLEEAISKGGEKLLEIASVPPEIVESMNLIDQYMSSRRYSLAMDEAYHIIQTEPDYLAVHIRIGQILTHMNQFDRAAEKYNRIAETYLVRDNKPRALDMMAEVVKLSPTDVQLRQNLITLLEEEGRWDGILEQYVNLAQAYLDLADVSNARMTINQSLQIAERNNLDKNSLLPLLHRLADVELTRLQTRPALRVYEEIKSYDPDDTEAREKIIDLNFRLGDPAGAVREMDTLLQIYAKKRDGKAIITLLEGWVQKRPEDESIRTRLATIYQQIKRPNAALKQYNTILEVQLKQNRQNEACATLKKILSMQPPDAERYQQLGQQLGCM